MGEGDGDRLAGRACRLNPAADRARWELGQTEISSYTATVRLTLSTARVTGPEAGLPNLMESLQGYKEGGKPEGNPITTFQAGCVVAGDWGNQQVIVVPMPSSLSADTRPP